MLNLIGRADLKELDKTFKSLYQSLDIKISRQEISDYTNEFIKNEEKLKNHPETINEKEIQTIYYNSLKEYII